MPGGGTVLTRTASQNQFGHGKLVELQPLQVGFAHDLPDIPVLPKTLLLLELMVQEPCVDLREFSQLVLTDLGASVQILRLAGRVYGNGEGRPTRMVDCITDLGLDACLQAVSAQSLARDGRLDVITQLWNHSKEIAQQCKYVADLMVKVNPEEAYLTGLLHAIGLLPDLLEWNDRGAIGSALIGLRLAKGWFLPPCVAEFYREIHFAGYPALWLAIVQEAHQRASRSSVECTFDHVIGPRLVRNRQERETAGYR